MIGERTAENIKINIGGAYAREKQICIEARGRNLISGLPVTIKINSDEILGALERICIIHCRCRYSVLERTPPELAADIADLE